MLLVVADAGCCCGLLQMAAVHWLLGDGCLLIDACWWLPAARC